MLVMDAIAQILKREGISTLFCFPTTPIIEAAVAAGMRPIICRQERVGVDMADGLHARHERPTGRRSSPCSTGPGAENAFPGIATAYLGFDARCCCCRSAIRAIRRSSSRMFKSTRTYASVTKSVEELTLPGQVGAGDAPRLQSR